MLNTGWKAEENPKHRIQVFSLISTKLHANKLLTHFKLWQLDIPQLANYPLYQPNG